MPPRARSKAVAPAPARPTDGNTYPVSELNTFTAFDAGSSRRRWVALMDDDDETLSVEVGQVLEVFEYITEQAAEQAAAAS
jgi:hypothetical protein